MHFKKNMKVFLVIFFVYTCYMYLYIPVIVNQQERNSFRVLNVQNYVPKVLISDLLTNTESGTAILCHNKFSRVCGDLAK